MTPGAPGTGDTEPPVAQLDTGRYQVLVAPALLGAAGRHITTAAPAHRYAIVTDTTVGPLYAGTLAGQLPAGSVEIVTIPAGEAHKTRDTWAAVTDHLLARGFGRDSAVVALGGGVVGDLAGFVAATFMRGIPLVHVPTTLLAMIDAAIGGKTGVDTPVGKNLVGAFHPPRAVLSDPVVLETLPAAELRSGLAEALKHGVVADAEHFAEVARLAGRLSAAGPAGRDPAALAGVIRRSAGIKIGVVRSDEHERGVRKTLNFGHTVGHAIELLSGYAIRHGEAVACGMVAEARAGELAGITEPGTAQAIADAVRSAGLPSAPPPSIRASSVLDAMRTDKKGRRGGVEFAIPVRLGQMAGTDRGYAIPLDDRFLLEALVEVR